MFKCNTALKLKTTSACSSRALYGLKQSPLPRHEELKKFLNTLNFTSIPSDIFAFRNANGQIIVIYVDDMLIVARSLVKLLSIAQSLKDRFKMRELGEIHYYLGMRIIRNRASRTVHVVQDAYL